MFYRKLIGIVSGLTIILSTGVVGYVYIEGWSAAEALYMTVITLSSVGFMEVHPLSNAGRTFTMFLILSGSGVLIYCISVLTAFVIEGQITDVFRRIKMTKKIDSLRGHYIVCGADQTGRYVIEEMAKIGKDFVVIEKDPEKVKGLISRSILCIEGDATHDADLTRARIHEAAGLITSLHSDAENLFVVITGKRLNPSLRVISKAIEEESEQKIRMVGADAVIMPNYIGGLRMVSEMVRPSVVTFLDIMLRVKDKTIRLEEIELEKTAHLVRKTLKETGMLTAEGISIVALKNKKDDSYIFNPPAGTLLTEDHALIVMGNVDVINGFASGRNIG